MRNFDRITKLLASAHERSLTECQAILRRECPEVVRQIEDDIGVSGPMVFWGDSMNVDEFAGKAIVPVPVLETIFSIAQRRLSVEHPHAGLQHTYGYLFSLIETPFGKKRDRWVRTSLEESLGLSHDALSPSPTDGTLLANATWLAGNIAFQGHSRREWLRRCLARRCSSAVRDLDCDALRGWRYTETVPLSTSPGNEASVLLITDVVRIPAAGDSDAWLLVYSVHDSRSASPQLITLFTVGDAFIEALRERASVRRRSDIRLRYNAYVRGFPAELQTGTAMIRKR